MHPWRIVTLVGGTLGGLSLLLPVATFPVIGPVDGIDGQAWPVFLLLGPAILVAILGDRHEGLSSWIGLPLLVLAGGAVAFAAVKLADAVLAVRAAGGSVGSGVWGVLVASIAVMAGLGLSLRRTVG